MTPWTDRTRLFVTPLSPLHIGCGADFDPTEYVISEGLLYKFDPSNLPLTDEDRQELNVAVALGGAKALLRIQNFFHKRRKDCEGHAMLAIPVSKGLESQYQLRIGQVAQFEPDGNFISRLVIERTAHHPHSGVPYLPGSGLKGSMRTAWLDRLNKGRTASPSKRWSELETELLAGGRFDKDPFRLVTVSDASGSNIVSRIVFHTNHRKVPAVGRDGFPRTAQGLAVRRECIAHGQIGALSCEIAIDSLKGRDDPATPAFELRLKGWADLAQACNRYYLPRLRKEAEFFRNRGLVDRGWVSATMDLLDRLKVQFDSGAAVLLRVGRHSGSENITLDGVRSIRIRRSKGESEQSSTGGTTLWLAAETEGDTSDMHPLGWVLLHRELYDPVCHWGSFFKVPDLSMVHLALRKARESAREAAEQRRQKALENARLEDERKQQLMRQQEKLNAMSENGRLVEALRVALSNYNARRPQAVGGELYQKTRSLIAIAEGGEWLEEDRRRLGELLRDLVPQKIDLGGRAKEIRQAANRLLGL